MTDDEVQAVCERHGVRVASFAVTDAEIRVIGTQFGATDDRSDQFNGFGPDRASAVCDHLMNKYRSCVEYRDGGFRAVTDDGESEWSDDTVLAAVVALADRLQQRAEG